MGREEIAELLREPEKIRILLPRDGTCPECAAIHDAKSPHYRGSLYYQMRFQQKHGRLPTWRDALAHCPKIITEEAIRYLREKGVPEDELGRKEEEENG